MIYQGKAGNYKELKIIDGYLYGRNDPDQTWSELSAGEAAQEYRVVYEELEEIKKNNHE